MIADFRSLLLVPADSPARIAGALASGADALILDLDDMVASEHRSKARQAAANTLMRLRHNGDAPLLFVRISSLDSDQLNPDLAAVMGHGPDAIILPKARGGADVEQLATLLLAHETDHGLPAGSTRILPLVTDTGAAMFGLSTYAGCSPRLLAVAWSAEDLASDIGADDTREDNGDWSAPFAMARNLALYAAAHAGVPAIDTLFRDFGDRTGLRHEAMRAEADGFCAKMAVHPDQIGILNQVFTPHGEKLDRANVLVAAFAASPHATHVSIEGRVYDKAQWARAQLLVARARRGQS